MPRIKAQPKAAKAAVVRGSVLALSFFLSVVSASHADDDAYAIYDTLAPPSTSSSPPYQNIGPPTNTWADQHTGQPPPGSVPTATKREMFGGNLYGAFDSRTSGRLETEETVAGAYR
eukprot:3940317-Rhodomonas_salina.3